MKHNKIKVAISVGDINGIGLEIIMKSFSDPRMFDFCTPILYTNLLATKIYKKKLGIADFNYHTIKTYDKSNSKN